MTRPDGGRSSSQQQGSSSNSLRRQRQDRGDGRSSRGHGGRRNRSPYDSGSNSDTGSGSGSGSSGSSGSSRSSSATSRSRSSSPVTAHSSGLSGGHQDRNSSSTSFSQAVYPSSSSGSHRKKRLPPDAEMIRESRSGKTDSGSHRNGKGCEGSSLSSVDRTTARPVAFEDKTPCAICVRNLPARPSGKCQQLHNSPIYDKCQTQSAKVLTLL